MAHGVDKDEFLYDLDNLTQMMETSKILDSYETTGARPKKAKAKRTSSKATGESKAKPSSDTPPEPSITASLELEKLKNQNLKLQLEIRKAELELARLKERPSTEPSSTAMDAQSPCLLENAITSTPAQSSMTTGLPTLTQLRDKKKPGATLPHNYVFSSKGTLTYESLDIPDFIYGFLEFYKEQSPTCKQALLKHLQLLMERAATYTWPSVRSFHLAIATAVEQGRLSWTSSEAIRERAQTFFSHQDLRTQPRPTSSQRQISQTSLPRGNRAQKESLCRDWNYTGKCSCPTAGATYSTTHRCRVCDSSDHPMLHCAKRRFPIPASPSPGANQDQAKE